MAQKKRKPHAVKLDPTIEPDFEPDVDTAKSKPEVLTAAEAEKRRRRRRRHRRLT